MSKAIYNAKNGVRSTRRKFKINAVTLPNG